MPKLDACKIDNQKIDGAIGELRFTSGDNLLYSLTDTEIQTKSSYTKMKDVDVNCSGTIKVTFSIQVNTTGQTGKARIYVNDVAVGTERSVPYSSGKLTFSEDINISKGDNVQIWGIIMIGRLFLTNITFNCAETPPFTIVL